MATLSSENYAGTTLLVLTMTLISIGLVAISSASISLSEARFGAVSYTHLTLPTMLPV